MNTTVTKPEMDKPEYRFECRIVDANTGEVVIQANTYINNEKRTHDPILGMEQLDEEPLETELWSMMRHFRNKIQERYEEENYGVKEDEDE